ncbi:hypothetical protein [Paradevosia shaoguanensis]|uniref:hypothetical protein n=1 Tax=Paradevosia shaoguanensis TaxID=1335043 RepID=UPI001934A1E7|nr:hypothetical protein [Paradevosia shaoguanensis]
MSRWFRHYAGMMRDEKLVAVAIRAKQPVERVVWVWGAILESAAEIDDDGRFEVDAAEVAYFLRTDEADICAVVSALADANRVASNRVVKWGDRQYQSDSSKERQARYRERRRAEISLGGDHRKASDVTNASRDGEVTAQETDTETEKKEEHNGSSKKRGSRLPADWVPDVAFALSLGLSQADVDLETQKFREWWPAQPGQKGVKLDWGLTWMTWCRKALADRSRFARGSPPPQRAPSQADVFAFIARKSQDDPGQEHEDRRRVRPAIPDLSAG